jgi:hypothetical protein
MDMERGEEDLVGASGWCPAPPTCPAVGLGANDIILWASQAITLLFITADWTRHSLLADMHYFS